MSEITIYSKTIQFDVVFREEIVWPFAKIFGREFATQDAISRYNPRPIDGYYVQGENYHVQVSVPVSEEQHFYDFLRNFCNNHCLAVREEDLKPGSS